MAAVICAVFAAGCQGKTPQRAADSYLANLKLFNYPACYQALSHQDQVDRTLDQFLTEIPMAPDVSKEWFKGILRTYDYKVGDTKIEGDKAIVTVSVTRPDLALWERTASAKASGDTTPDRSRKRISPTSTYPKVTYDDDMVMVNQGGEWRLLVDFPFKENIIKEHKDAVDLYHQHDYDKAIAAYQKIIDELDKEQATGNEGLKWQYGRELAEHPDRAEAASRGAGLRSEDRAERRGLEDVGVARAGNFRQDDQHPATRRSTKFSSPSPTTRARAKTKRRCSPKCTLRSRRRWSSPTSGVRCCRSCRAKRAASAFA